MGSAHADQKRHEAIEHITEVLERLSSLRPARPRGRRPAFTSGEVDRMLRSARLIHRLVEDGAGAAARPADVAIDIARDKDGSVVVFPASAA